VEIETLFNRTIHPNVQGRITTISRRDSQRMMRGLARYGWRISERNQTAVQAHQGTATFLYELGWSNFELNSPTALATAPAPLFGQIQQSLDQLYASGCNAVPRIFQVERPCDRLVDQDTLLMPDTRDEIWSELDGPVLRVLGHIASVQYTVDVQSVDEAFEFIRALQPVRAAEGWPRLISKQIWQRYLQESRAGYEPHRYGKTPDNFSDYCDVLAATKVVMNRRDGELVRMQPACPFAECGELDMELFIRSVWWWERLRVRNGRLMLEIRDIPRTEDIAIPQCWNRISAALGLDVPERQEDLAQA
jgi:hypothetical protein